MRLELTRVGLLVELANHYTTRGACDGGGGWAVSDLATEVVTWRATLYFELY